jgi:ribonuclease HII
MSEVPKKLTKKQKQLIREIMEEFNDLNMKVKNIKVNDLNQSNVSELKQIAKENNIKGYSTLRKQEIIDLLNEMRNTQFYKGREQTSEEKARDERIMNYVPQAVKPVIKKLSRDDMINELENKIANYEKKILEIEDKIDELNPVVHKKKITELEKKIDEYNKLMNEDYTKLREINPYMY